MIFSVTDNVKRIHITKSESENGYVLDDIIVYLDNGDLGKGRITIQCHSQVWSAYWPAMGECSVEDFFLNCGNEYLIGNLATQLKYEIIDFEKLYQNLLTKIDKKISQADSSYSEKMHWENIALKLNRNSIDFDDDSEGMAWVKTNTDHLEALLGGNWMYCMPMKINPDYKYLDRVVTAVKNELKEYSKLVK